MFESIALTVASLWQQATPGTKFHEEEIALSSTPIEITAPMEFTALGISDEDPLPEIYFRANENEDWRVFHIDDEYPLSTEILTGNPRYKISLKSSEPISGKITLIDTRKPMENLVARFDPFDDDSGDNPLTGLSDRISVMPPEYISREGWGANEKLRSHKAFKGFQSYFRDIVPEAKLLPLGKRPKIIAKEDEEGRPLTWPIEKNQEIGKFVIHHTGEVIDEERNPNEIMRAIYAFHTLTRGWGDVGYHYVIDSKGNIYEGRAGGPEIVGAHTAYYNVNTIGVALMGNFEREKPTHAQLEVLTLLLADHANRFDIDPEGKSKFLGQTSYNISGHRDVARRGHGTACPGKNLHDKLSWIRKETATKAEMLLNGRKTGRDFLSKSKAAAKYQREKEFVRKEKEPAIARVKLTQKEILKRGEQTILSLDIRNGSKFDWPKGVTLEPINLPASGISLSKFYSAERIPAGRVGTFQARIDVDNIPNGIYEVILIPKIFDSAQNVIYENLPIPYPIQVSGDQNMLMKRYTSKMKTAAIKPHYNIKSTSKVFSADILKHKEESPEIKVKLSYFDNDVAYLKSLHEIEIWSKNKKEATVPGNTRIHATPSDEANKVEIVFGKTKIKVPDPELRTNNGIIEITNYTRNYGRINYNAFRQQINIHVATEEGSKKLLLVNQLPLEEYLWGLGEEPSSEPTEKKHAIHVLARSYGLVYSGTKRKFRTSLYDLEDSPATSQLYLGYEWEKYHPEQKVLLKETEGMVMTYNGEPAIGPYFTQSSGWSSGAWRGQYPWTKAQRLAHDDGLQQKGHGVGLSGNTARELAFEGLSYEEILDYFFDGVEVEKEY